MRTKCWFLLVILSGSTAGCSSCSRTQEGFAVPFDRDWVLENYRSGPESLLGALGGTTVRVTGGRLEIDFHFDPRDPDRRQLEVMHELEAVGEPFGRTSDLLGAEITAAVDVPRALLSRDDHHRVAGIQLFCESENKDGMKGRQYSDWRDLDGATWRGIVQFFPSTRSTPRSYRDPEFRPDRIWQCGIKLALNDRASAPVSGTMKVSSLRVTLPSAEAYGAAKAELLQSIPRIPDAQTLGRLPALEPRDRAQRILPVGTSVTGSSAVTSVDVVSEPAGGDAKVWSVGTRFDRYSDSTDGRTARVSLSLHRAIDLRGKKVIAWVAVGPSLRGAMLRPNYVQLELEDANGRLVRGAAAALSGAGMVFDSQGLESESRWVLIQASPSAGRPLAMGSAADGFEPAAVRRLHVRFQVGKFSNELRDEPYPLAGRLLLSELRIDSDSTPQGVATTASTAAALATKPVAPDRFLVGLNLAFYQYADVGLYPYGGRDMGGFSMRPDKLHRHFALFRKNGIDAVRVFLLGDLRTGVARDPGGKVIGLDRYVERDIEALVAAATANSIRLVPVLMDFLALDNQQERRYGNKRWNDGEARRDILDPEFRTAFIENALRPIVKQLHAANARRPETVWALDIFNEPENAVGVATPADFQQLVAFVHQVRDMIRREAPGLRITIGSRDRRDLAAYWRTASDVHQFHFYAKHEDEDGLPLRFPAGQLGFREPVIVGEVEPDRIAERLDAIYESGYHGAFFWSYSGHDGYRVNLDEVRRWVENKRR